MPSFPPSDETLIAEYLAAATPRRDVLGKKYGVGRSRLDSAVKAAAFRLGIAYPINVRKAHRNPEWPPDDDVLLKLATQAVTTDSAWLLIAKTYGVSQETARKRLSECRKRAGWKQDQSQRRTHERPAAELVRMVANQSRAWVSDRLGINRSLLETWLIAAQKELKPTAPAQSDEDHRRFNEQCRQHREAWVPAASSMGWAS